MQMLHCYAVKTNQHCQTFFFATAEVSQSVPDDSQVLCTRLFHSVSTYAEEWTLMWHISD